MCSCNLGHADQDDVCGRSLGGSNISISSTTLQVWPPIIVSLLLEWQHKVRIRTVCILQKAKMTGRLRCDATGKSLVVSWCWLVWTRSWQYDCQVGVASATSNWNRYMRKWTNHIQSIHIYSYLFISIDIYSFLFISIHIHSCLFISILFISILFYSILFYPFLFYSNLFYSILFYSILSYSILSYSILFYAILSFSFLFQSILFYPLLFYPTSILF
jgi:hypothetical protein